MYSYYLDFLKSFKRFVASTFPNIKHYQFNYADNAFLNYKLYQEHVKEYPMCIISLTDITTDDNKDFFRYIGMKHSGDIAQVVASNHTKKDSVLIDFKWVTMQVQMKINLYGAADILNYHNQLISAFPKNMMFYSYKYNAYIHIDDYVQGWDVSDDTEGLHYRSDNQTVEGFALYNIEPIFRINSVTKNKVVDGETSLDISLEVRLKVPNLVGNISISNQIVNGIQIVINNTSDAKDLPILIDMNNDIYSDRQNKLKRSYILEEKHFDKDNKLLTIRKDNYQNVDDRPVAIYMVDDSTSPDPRIEFFEISLVTTDHIIQIEEYDETIDYYQFEVPTNLNSFQFSALSNIQLFVFE